jgi:acetyl esterase
MENTFHYQKLLAHMRANTSIITHRGLEMTIKPVPDAEHAGDLDPRVMEVTLEQIKKFASFPKLEAGEGGASEFPIKQVRELMGWPNLDIVTSRIDISNKVIEGRNGSIPIRIYSPEGGDSKPVIVFFHGGGFIGGTIEAVENPCKFLAEQAGAIVVNVDYRLAPEHPFPAGLHDCFDAVSWVHGHASEIGGHAGQIAVAGDSAGGNMSAVCALMDRDLGTGMIKYQALVYPTVNMAGMETEDFKWGIGEYEVNRNHELVRGVILALNGGKEARDSGEESGGLHSLYLQGNERMTAPYVSPLLTDLQGLPPTLLIEAEYDYLRLEGEAYARKLIRSGVPARMIRYNGMDHAFMDKIGLYPQAEDCMKEIALGVRDIFNLH